jgi:DNA polymerase III subunit alpha
LFAHLHLHTEYSALDSIVRVKDLPSRAKELGQTAVAMTDHGTLGASLKFYKECRKVGVKPIIGLEAYYTFDRRHLSLDKYDQRAYHLVFLARNDDGLRNLMAMSARAYSEGFYYTGRIDKELIEEYHEDLICTSACIQSPLSKLRQFGSNSEAEDMLCYLNELFPGQFFLEVMDLPFPEQEDYNRWLLSMGEKHDIPLILTCDVHYLNKEDGFTAGTPHEVALCIGVKATLETTKFSYVGNEHWLKSEDEVRESLQGRLSGFPEEIISNTQRVADLCSGVYFTKKEDLMPKALGVSDARAELELQSKWGLVDRFGGDPNVVPQEYKARLDHELNIIHTMGFDDYFLIVADYVEAAKDRGILVGPGRGSIGGSLVAWALKITGLHLDPIRNGLYFERFLNPGRASVPDADLDFPPDERETMFKYIDDKYGKDVVYHIGTRETSNPRGLMWDVGRVLGYSMVDRRAVAKLIPEAHAGKEPTMEESVAKVPQLKRLHPEIVEAALRLDGTVQRPQVHASGMLISRKPIADYIPTFKNGTYDRITEFDMWEVEEFGLVKFDFLALRHLKIIATMFKYVEENHGIKLDWEEFPLDDEKVFDLMCDGKMEGLFQLEKSLADIIIRVQPRSVDDLSIVVAIGRPGPLQAGLLDTLLKCRQSGKPPEGMPEELAKVLEDTHYTYVYQEQVMRICQDIAGFSLSEADKMRKAIGKKKDEWMAALQEQFVDGCKQVGVLDETQATELFLNIQGFADYCFNKAHSYAYALISYYEAYVKTHYPAEYYAGLLSHKKDNEKVSDYRREAESLEIKVGGPNINTSGPGFTPTENAIFFGFRGIKGVGAEATRSIIRGRGATGYQDIWDFCDRTNRQKVNGGVITHLVHAGAFDTLGYDREELVNCIPDIVGYYKQFSDWLEKKKANQERAKLRKKFEALDKDAQVLYRETYLAEHSKAFRKPIVRETPDKPEKPEIPKHKRTRITPAMLAEEGEVLGCYLTAHPAEFIRLTPEMCKVEDMKRAGQVGRLGVMLSTVKVIKTKRGQLMAFVGAEDDTGHIEVTVFPKVYKKYAEKLRRGAIAVLSCKIDPKRPNSSFAQGDIKNALADHFRFIEE